MKCFNCKSIINKERLSAYPYYSRIMECDNKKCFHRTWITDDFDSYQIYYLNDLGETYSIYGMNYFTQNWRWSRSSEPRITIPFVKLSLDTFDDDVDKMILQFDKLRLIR